MKKLLFLFLVIFIFFESQAQVYRNVVMGGDRMTIRSKRSDSDLQGSPYLFGDWQKAIVQFAPGTEPASAEIKYDLLDDLLVLKGTDGGEYEFKDQPKEFLISGTKELYKNGFVPVDKFTDKTFYNVIYDGKAKFLKKVSKVILESKGYNTASVEKKVADETAYYLVKEDNKPVKVKNEKSIIAFLGKADQLLKYIKENRLDLKSNDGMIKLLTFYDTL
ncbi:hypothetical protein [Pedobacter sp. BMA]|uniref:hypothetical protein n=1 Tax=Pedobacter sp. BMA TaxID=1663685 RepID=UPI000649383A|nr:hypothetical protein [Pedobacter sp. BMA]KLT64684.1 hypothetical protein AB669_13065 [Pedobacter sp. BMA]